MALDSGPRSSACWGTLQDKTVVLKAKGSLQAHLQLFQVIRKQLHGFWLVLGTQCLCHISTLLIPGTFCSFILPVS